MHLLWLIIFLEGFAVLATELLAIRLMLPFVGSGTEIVAIIISAVLMPLAFGYHHGGKAYSLAWHTARSQGKRPRTTRELLSYNALHALCILALGLSYPVLAFFTSLLEAMGIRNPIAITTLYSLCFLVVPVYLLAQTIPLISRYFRYVSMHHVTGKMLYYSTIGSFLGSIITTLVIMPFLGVHYAAMIIGGVLTLLVLLPLRRRFDYSMVLALLFLGLCISFNAPSSLRNQHIVSNNGYNLIAVRDDAEKNTRHMIMNHSNSSAIAISGTEDKRHEYIRMFEAMVIDGNPAAKPREILVLGAGGFTAGLYDRKNRYTYVDIDPALKDVAEQHFLQHPLHPNQTFVAQSARAYLNESKKLYDAVLVDTYTHVTSIPLETISVEFLQKIHDRLKPDGLIVANVIGTPLQHDLFMQHYANGFMRVFPHHFRQVVKFQNIAGNPLRNRNILFVGQKAEASYSHSIYHDLKNRYMYDR
jgi:spermidine synthase